MGQRGNYIIKSKDVINIYYTHWRANSIARDLMIGTTDFIEFITGFEKKNELINIPWIEGCVYLDTESKELLFWESELLCKRSIRQAYLQKLQIKWPGWKICYAEQGMYDIEKKAGIDYTFFQKTNFDHHEIDEVIHDPCDEFSFSNVIIKKGNDISLKHPTNLYPDEILLIGESVIEVLRQKPDFNLDNERNTETSILIIDCDQKRLILNDLIIGLREEIKYRWVDWELEMGHFGYIRTLEKAGVNTDDLKMSPNEIESEMNNLLNYTDNFDPQKTLNAITQTSKNVKVHPNFLENRKPGNFKKSTKTFWQKMRAFFKSKN